MAEGDRDGDRLGQVDGVELPARHVEVDPDRAVSEVEDPRDLLERPAAGRPLEAFSLTGRKRASGAIFRSQHRQGALGLHERLKPTRMRVWAGRPLSRFCKSCGGMNFFLPR